MIENASLNVFISQIFNKIVAVQPWKYSWKPKNDFNEIFTVRNYVPFQLLAIEQRTLYIDKLKNYMFDARRIRKRLSEVETKFRNLMFS